MNVIIIHGCPSNIEKAMNPKTRNHDKHWMPWLKKQLIKYKIQVKIPLMPEPWAPDYNKFKKEFEKYKVDKDTVLIGHSCGCAFLVRWLGESKQQIKKLILVAPWKIPFREDGSDVDFYTYSIDKTIKSRVKKTIIFTSNDEEEDGKRSAKIFNNDLNGRIILLKNHGHYTLGDMGTEEFPELLKEIIS